MEERKVNPAIIKVILSSYLPGTEQKHDKVIEIDEFISLWNDENRPVLSDIEEVMEYLGFKKEESRKEFEFYVKLPDKTNEAIEVK